MISKEQYQTIRRMAADGYKTKTIAERVGISEPSVRKWAKIAEATFQELLRNDIPYMDQYREFILSILRVTPQIKETNILYRLKEAFPDFNCNKRTFYRYMNMLREQTGFEKVSTRSTSPREETPPGYEAQADFGQFKTKDMYGKPVRVYFFCMVLSFSRMHFVYFSRTPFTTKTAIEAHNYAFRYYGGRPQVVVYDQDRVYVVSENFGNIVLVPDFEEYVRKTGFAVHLCRPHDPQSKGKIETFVRYVKESFLEGRIYTGIDALNSAALCWLDAEGNGTTNLRTRKPPRELFLEEARHLTKLQFLDKEPVVLRSVSDKYLVKVDWSVYELPHNKVKQYDQVRIEEQDGMLLFYRATDGTLIHKCAKKNEGGVTAYEVKQDFVATNAIRQVFKDFPVVHDFVEQLAIAEPRYKNVQCNRIIALSNMYTVEQVAEAMEYCVRAGAFSSAEITAFLIFRHGEAEARRRLSKNAYYLNRDRAEEIRREQNGRYL